MKYIKSLTGNKNLSRICFGAASISSKGGGYGFGDIDPSNCSKLLDFVFENGVNVFDTAPIYGFGESEKTLGKWAKDKRDDCFIISKAGVDWHENGRVNMTNRPEVISSMLENSLKRLDSDYIDLYMIHWPDTRTQIEDSVDILLKAKDQGKIRHIGLCNTNSSDLVKVSNNITFLQSETNIFNDGFRSYGIEKEKNDFLTMGWGTFDKGILTGAVTEDRKFDKSDARSWAPWWKKSNWKEKVTNFSMLNTILKYHNITPIEFSLSYSLVKMENNFACVGSKSINQFKEIIDSSENLLDVKTINQILREYESVF